MKNIVVIEDNADIQHVFELALRSDDYTITCYDHAEAFLKAPAPFPDVIMLDNNMPGISGISLCARLKAMEDYRDVPIVIMSADVDFAEKALAAGAENVLPKPFMIKKLRAMISEYVNRSKR